MKQAPVRQKWRAPSLYKPPAFPTRIEVISLAITVKSERQTLLAKAQLDRIFGVVIWRMQTFDRRATSRMLRCFDASRLPNVASLESRLRGASTTESPKD